MSEERAPYRTKPPLERRKVSYLIEPSPELPRDWEGPVVCSRCHRRAILLATPTMHLFRHAAEQARLNASWAWITVSAQECVVFPGVEDMIEPTRKVLEDLDRATAHLHRVDDFEVDLDRMIDHDANLYRQKDGPATNSGGPI